MSETTSAAAESSTADGTISLGSNLKIVGIILAVCSGILIGSSFVFKKKGLLKSQEGQVAGEGVAYLKSSLWWIGMIMMIVGEICNFAAYAFVEAIVVTPLGALSVVVCAILSSIFLNEKLSFFGWLGCALCILGSVIIALNGPKEAAVGQIREFQKLFLAPGFLAYTGTLIAASLVLIFFFAPKYGKKSMLWYIFICSMIGGISVSVTTGVGAAIVTTAQGDNQFKHWFLYFLIGFVVITLVVEIYYLNMALALYNTAMVTPTYYVIFTFFAMVTTVVLFQGLKASVSQILTIVMAFLTICLGITILQMSKVDPSTLSKLDRRSTILLQAARQHTETLEEKGPFAGEDPGIDALRGSFGTIGSIVRARSARRMSQSSNATGWRPRGAGQAFNPHGESWVSNRFMSSPPPSIPGGDVENLGGMKRHQLYDAPMPMSPGTDGDGVSLKSPSVRSDAAKKQPTIKFGSQDVVHSYLPTKDGQADARHEHRAIHLENEHENHIDNNAYPPLPLSAMASSSLSTPLVDTGGPHDDISIGTTLTIPAHLRDMKEAQSAPATMVDKRPLPKPGQGRVDSRQIFGQGGKNGSQASLHSFPSVTDSAPSLAWGEEGGNTKSWTDSIVSSSVSQQGSPGKRDKSKERGRAQKNYPKGDGADDRAESVSLWQKNGGSGEDGDLDGDDDGTYEGFSSESGSASQQQSGIRLVAKAGPPLGSRSPF